MMAKRLIFISKDKAAPKCQRGLKLQILESYIDWFPFQLNHRDKQIGRACQKRDITSFSSISKRISGLSEPYLLMASAYVTLGKGFGSSTPLISRKTCNNLFGYGR